MRSLRVAVLSTGDEVADPGGPLPEGAIYDANRPLLMELIRAIGADPIDLGIVRDDADSLRHHLRHAASIADAVITSGGVSVGEADHTRAVMQSLGEIAFWKLAIKPGRPLAAGWIHNESGQRTPFGLPGNPVAAFVTFQGIVGPCLQRLGGATPVKQPTVRARLARATKKHRAEPNFSAANSHAMHKATGAPRSQPLRVRPALSPWWMPMALQCCRTMQGRWPRAQLSMCYC